MEIEENVKLLTGMLQEYFTAEERLIHFESMFDKEMKEENYEVLGLLTKCIEELKSKTTKGS